MQYLEMYCQQCSNLRMLRMYEGWMVRLIPHIDDVTCLAGSVHVLSAVCYRSLPLSCLILVVNACARLRFLKWMPTVRAKFGPLSGRLLHKIESALSKGAS